MGRGRPCQATLRDGSPCRSVATVGSHCAGHARKLVEAGKAVPRAAQRASLAAMRGVGKREAAKRLEALA